MRFITISDAHLQLSDPLGRIVNGYNTRLLEKLSVLNKAINFGVSESVDFITFNGDTFNMPNPNPKLKSLFIKLISKAIKNNIRIYIIPGNHDLFDNQLFSFSSEYELLSLTKCNLFNVITENKSIEIHDHMVSFIPFNRDVNSIQSYLQKCKNHIVFGHFPIINAYNDNKTLSDSGVSVHYFEGIKSVYLGHFHRSQEGENWRYTSSPYHTDFKSLDAHKGFVYSNLEGSKITDRFINLLDYDKKFGYIKVTNDNLSTILSTKEFDYDIVKIKFTGDRSWFKSIDRLSIKNHLHSNGVSIVKLDYEYTDSVENIEISNKTNMNMNILTMIKNSCEQKNKMRYLDIGIDIVNTVINNCDIVIEQDKI